MAPSPHCDRCRAPLASGPLGGVCPVCIFRDAQSGVFEAMPGDAPSPDEWYGTREPGGSLRDFGAYTLLEQIGQGGMGVVYRARHRVLGREVALKLLIAGEFSSPDFVDRFRREAATAASLRHPGIVAVYEAGEISGQPFLAMELVQGITLADRIRERPLPPRDAARHVRTVSEAVQHAHDSGLLHRDLKPANILLDRGDRPRVTDFGLAKRLDGSTDLTLTGQMLGSPHYLSPEAALGAREGALTPASDVYSLGATLYHGLTGRPPLLADSLAETLAQVRDQPPVSPRLLNPAIPRDLETICLKCLEKSPAQRYSSARELADDLGRWERGEPIRARPATPAERAVKWMRRHPARAALTGVMILSAAVLISGSLWFNVHLTAARNEANANRQRAEASQRTAESSEAAGRRRLVRMQVATANRLAAEGDPLAAALWSAAALQEESSAAAELPHRRRLAAEWALAPRLVGLGLERNATLFAASGPDATTAAPFRMEDGPDGNVSVYRRDGIGVLFVDPEPGGPAEPTPFLPGAVGARDLTLTPSGQQVSVVSGQGRHRVWDLQTGRPLTKPLAIEAWEAPPRFRADGTAWARMFQEADQWFVELHSIPETGDMPLRRSLDSQPFAVDFDPAGRWLMTAHWDGTIRLWSPDTLKLLATPIRSPSGIAAAAFSPDGSKLATGGWNHEAQVWTLPDGRPTTPPLRLGRPVVAVEFSRDGRYLAVRGQDDLDRIWDLHIATRPMLEGMSGGASWFLWNVTSNARGVIAAWDRADRGHFWVPAADTPAGSRHQPAEVPVPEDRSALTHLELSADGRLAVAARQSGRFVLWDVESGRIRHQFRHGTNLEVFTGISADGRWVASAGSDGVLQCWDTTTGQAAAPPFQQGAPISDPVFSSDSRRLAVASLNGHIQVLDRETSSPWGPPLVHSHAVGRVSFSPDGTRLLTAMGDHSSAPLSAQVWELPSGRRIGAPMQHADGVSVARFFPDGTRILTAGEDGQARVWNAADGLPLTPWMRCGRRIFRAEVSSDGLVVATLDEGQRLRLWDAQTGELLSANPSGEPVSHATFADAGRLVYSTRSTGGLHWLALPVAQGLVGDLAALARLSAGFEIDATGGLAPLPAESLLQLHERLRVIVPAHFETRLFDPGWHRQELARVTAIGEPFAIRFHTEALARPR